MAITYLRVWDGTQYAWGYQVRVDFSDTDDDGNATVISECLVFKAQPTIPVLTAAIQARRTALVARKVAARLVPDSDDEMTANAVLTRIAWLHRLADATGNQNLQRAVQTLDGQVTDAVAARQACVVAQHTVVATLNAILAALTE